MEPVRIRRIQVKKLFGRIDYDIELPDCNPISIITAPNGMGKTTILNLVTLLLAPQTDAFLAIYEIPFTFVRCTLSNGKKVELSTKAIETQEKQIERKGGQEAIITQTSSYSSRFRSVNRYFKSRDFYFRIYKDDKPGKRMSYKETYCNMFSFTSPDDLEDDDEDMPYRGQVSPRQVLNNLWKRQRRLLEVNNCLISVNYVRADRIQPQKEHSRRYSSEYGEPAEISPLKKACDNVRDQVIQATEKYNEAVSEAKDTLPQMFLDVSTKDDEGAVAFMSEWSKYREELTQFQEIGLIPPTADFTEGIDIASVYDEKGSFLSTYLKAFKPTTAQLKDIYARLNLFKSILDERNAITGKKVSFNRGRIELSAFGRSVPLESLSSGEKHDFIMFYNLIFNSPNGSLVLVDEPEISLHIEWQESYLDRLNEICQMNGLTAIIATHSPNIVSSHYDWLVDKNISED